MLSNVISIEILAFEKKLYWHCNKYLGMEFHQTFYFILM